MDTSLRRQGIQDLIEREGYVRLSALSVQFGVAAVTIHRDLDHLAAIGVAERVRGGARRPRSERHEIMSDFRLRSAQALAQKSAIARRALREIPGGATIFLDSSTTVLALSLQLAGAEIPGLTVVTNSPAIAAEIHAPFAHVIVAPGELDQSLRAVTGRWTVEFLSNLTLSVAFVSAAGLTIDGGIMTGQRELAEVTKAVFLRSERHVVLADSSKFDNAALMSMGSLQEADLVITDDQITAETLARYRDAGVPLITATGDDHVRDEHP